MMGDGARSLSRKRGMKEVPTLTRLKCCLLLALACAGCGAASKASQPARTVANQSQARAEAQRPSSGSPFLDRLVEAAIGRTSHEGRYDQSYFTIAYPGGGVPADVGVCTDEGIRSYRAVGVDLQKEGHEDKERAFDSVPHKWGLKKTDANIDHRRVRNLMASSERQGAGLPVMQDARDDRPGDVVT